MKKIMFSDKYYLTQLVFDGKKTQTRRVISKSLMDDTIYDEDTNTLLINTEYTTNPRGWVNIAEFSPYKVKEKVAIAQRYKDLYIENTEEYNIPHQLKHEKGWDNKMFVASYRMPHHIVITKVETQRLQDITIEDCYKEGISIDEQNPIEAYKRLINNTCGKSTWEDNPFVFVYTFKVLD